MSERGEGGSRWSSAREREERKKQRALEREQAKRERVAREAEDAEEAQRARRGLSDEERQTIRAPRFSSREPSAPEIVAGDTDSDAGDSVVAGSSVGTKWRDSVSETSFSSGGGSGLPPLPGDDPDSGGFRRRPGNGRILIFGLCLFALLGALLFTPLGPFGDESEPIRPTPSSTLPSIPGLESSDDEDVTAEDRPQAAAGQPIVCIDPGHGGWDTGWNRTELGENPYGPPIVTEAQLNLGMAYMLKAELESMGYFVVLTRPGGAAVNPFDQDVNGDGETRSDAENPDQAGDRDELQARINICNDAGADILISLHFDGIDDRSVRGFHVFYTAEREFGEQNALLANLVFREMDMAFRGTEMEGLGMGARRDTEIDSVQYESGTASHFIMTGPAVEFASITPSEMPGIIVEGGFLSSDADAAFIVQTANQQLLAEAYARGIQEYFEQYPPEG